ncbi:SGNH/GDSL hydrolase family protein [Agreia sp. COWG]|uniref:SGNH/GDSL hydrolase family protein n=1 Tax=Agreia sp. COWG TaxID=2773266 RepID=UPI0019276606|nr:SGNH/GDSL hydrolase family protein [Agreia sp. COWG]CAD6004098.1 SGNH_hydro domain-containing protein [Agreia sp. COWG]
MEQLGSPFSRRTFLVGSGAAAVGVGLATFAPAQRAFAAQTVLPKFTYGPQDRLAPFYAQRDRAGSEKATILMLGDSLTEGYGADTLQDGYPAQVREMLRSQFSPSAGRGVDYIAARHQVFRDGAPAWTEKLFTFTGPVVAASLYGVGRRCIRLDPTSVGTLAAREFTSFKLAWRAPTAKSAIQVRIDDGAWIAVPQENVGENTFTKAVSSSGPHTIQVQPQPDTSYKEVDYPQIEGVWLFNGDENRNIHVIEGGQSGSATWQFSSASNGEPGNTQSGVSSWADAIDRFAPSLVTMAWGTNDVRQKNQAQIKTETSRVISLIRAHTAAPILLIVPFKPVREGAARCTWADLRTGLADVAGGTRTVDYFDVGQYMTFGVNNDPHKWGFKDGIHLTSAGYAEMARVISAKLSAVPA